MTYALILEHPVHECIQHAKFSSHFLSFLLLLRFFLRYSHPHILHPLFLLKGRNERSPVLLSSFPSSSLATARPTSIFIVITNLIKFRASTSRVLAAVLNILIKRLAHLRRHRPRYVPSLSFSNPQRRFAPPVEASAWKRTVRLFYELTRTREMTTCARASVSR